MNLKTRVPFLAAMSSSRSDDVTKSVCPSEVNLFSLEHSKHLKSYVSVVSQECLKFKSLKGVSRVFQGCSKNV